MEERLMNELNVPVRIASDPLLTIALGGQRAIQDADLLERITL
jgi:actin-like ATPase involved in cell morphogenesis